jgi:hypothetical protein
MANKSYKTEVITANTNLLVIENSTQLSKEVLIVLREKNNLNLEIISKFPTLLNQTPNIVIFFFKPELSQKNIIQLLDYCVKHEIKILIILPGNNSSKKTETQKLLFSYPQKNLLNHQIISVNLQEDTSQVVEQIISSFYYGFKIQPRIPLPIQESKTVYKKTIIKKNKKILFPILLLIILPYLFLTLQLGILFIYTRCSLVSYLKSDVYQTVRCVNISEKLSKIIYPQTEYLPGVSLFLSKMNYPPEKVLNLLRSFNTSQNQYQQLLTSTTLPQTKYYLNSLSESLGVVQSYLKDLYLSSPTPSPYLLDLGKKIVTSRFIISNLFLIANDSKYFIPEKKINYLILIQDQSKIRPTGGYLDSIAIITVDSGKVTQIQSFSTNLTDSQMVGQVNPPISFQNSTGLKQWLMRDANWDPDFPTSASKVAWFVDKELSIPVDVVVAINSGIFSKSLDIYSQTPASDLRETFIQIIKSVQNSTPVQRIKLYSLILNQLETHQILIHPLTFSSDSLKNSGWDGALTTTPCQTSLPCIVDLYYPVDSNVGANVNISKIFNSSQVDIQLSPSQISTSIHYQINNYDLENIYKNYLRIYLPKNTILDTLIINGEKQNIDFTTVFFEHNLQILGSLIQVDPKTTSNIALSYHQPIYTNSRFRYQLDIPKQPGILNHKTQISVNYPPNWTVSTFVTAKSLVSPVASAGLLRYNDQSGEISKLEFDILPTK